MNRDRISNIKKYNRNLANVIKTNGTRNLDYNLRIYLGLDSKKFYEYIINQLSPEMTIDNYGILWNIDHIFPCHLFNENIEQDMKLLFNYRNFRPLLKTDNFTKAGKINIDDLITYKNMILKNDDSNDIMIFDSLTQNDTSENIEEYEEEEQSFIDFENWANNTRIDNKEMINDLYKIDWNIYDTNTIEIDSRVLLCVLYGFIWYIDFVISVIAIITVNIVSV